MIRISVKAKPNAGKVLVEELGENRFVVSVKEPPEKGLANLGIIRALSIHFGVPQSRVSIVRGFSSRNKVFSVEV